MLQKKRRLLALPKSPKEDVPMAQAQTEETNVNPAPAPEAINHIDDSPSKSAPPLPVRAAGHGSLFKFYEHGVGDDWIQLAWMRTRVERNEVLDMKLPAIACTIEDLVQLPQDVPTSLESMRVEDGGSTPAPSAPNAMLDTNELLRQVRAWFVDPTSSLPTEVWAAIRDHLQACDWSSLLDMPDIPITALVSLCPSNALLHQVWLRGPLVASLVKPFVGTLDDDLPRHLRQWLAFDWALTVPAKDFRACLRKLNLRASLGDDQVGAAVEVAIVRVFHELRGYPSFD
ncbi:Aste57867_23148 [Aphanomyces stellatus]|uniref:Aste57867_23148 protein n=1 Tax=Aphanomyces stellatus TaxID=120398 RepID=A0A485LM36_9STRA|nr:hypothetical protein As57867_023077 [Aphanomyces stellatus]VFT99796.1 Aste57867_23148 [Aphanomyces stellatus]